MYVAISTIKHSRQMRYKSLNEYRKRFSLKPYGSFEELTGKTRALKFIDILYYSRHLVVGKMGDCESKDMLSL